MKPIPILFVDHATAMGGAEQSLKLLTKHLDPDQWEMHLACTHSPLARTFEPLNVTTHKLHLPQLRRSFRSPYDWWLGVNHLAHLARAIDARAIISNTIRATIYAGFAAKMTRTSFVWTMRDFWLGESKPRILWFDRLGKQILCQMAKVVIANSYATANQLPCKSKTTVIHNGIETNHFNPSLSQYESRAAFNLPDDAYVIGMIGRLRPWKGQIRFLRLLKSVLHKHPNTLGLITGGTPFNIQDNYVAQLHQAVKDLDLQDRVIFTDQLDDIRPALAAMDIFVHPGDPEPFGLVNIEAMAMAKPVVAFAHGALPEIVTDGETGLLVPPDDEQAMVEAISTLLKNLEQRSAMGIAGRHRVEQEFSIARTAKAFDNVLASIVV